MKYIIFLTLLFLLLVDAKVVKGGKKKKKKKKKPFNANKFKSTMAKAKRRSKEKASKICAKIVKAARKGDMEFLKPGGGNLSKKKRAGLVLDCTDEVGYSPLHHAARKGQHKFLKTLLEMGASVDIENTQAGWTPLFEASYWGQWKAVDILLKAGANPNHLTKKDQNGLHIASQGRYGNEGKIVKKLIMAGAHVDTIDIDERTPLFDAAENGCLECAKELVKFGAQPTQKDKAGQTAMGHASRLGFNEMNSFFNKHERGPSDDEGFDHTPESVEDTSMPPIEEEIVEEGEEKLKDSDVEDVVEL